METRTIIKHKAQTERLVDKCPSSAKIRQNIATNLARQLLIIICLTSRSVFEKSRDCVKSARRLQKSTSPLHAQPEVLSMRIVNLFGLPLRKSQAQEEYKQAANSKNIALCFLSLLFSTSLSCQAQTCTPTPTITPCQGCHPFTLRPVSNAGRS